MAVELLPATSRRALASDFQSADRWLFSLVNPAKTNLVARVAEGMAGRKPGRRYLLGLSGGLDSCVLLDVLARHLGYRNLVLVHLNHRLRGRISGEDARFVRSLARSYGLPAEIVSEDVRTRAARAKQSLETAGRAARYRFFSEVGDRYRCRTILLAHHADDQVETLLLRLFRGAGGSGLAGILPVAVRRERSRSHTLIRPMLGVWKEELRDYAASHNLRWREDATNESAEFLRNRVRREVIPYLAEVFGRDIRPLLLRLAEQRRAERAYFTELVDRQARRRELSVEELRRAPAAVQRHLVYQWLTHQRIKNIGFPLVEAIRALSFPGAASSSVNLPGACRARRRRGRIYIDTP